MEVALTAFHVSYFHDFFSCYFVLFVVKKSFTEPLPELHKKPNLFLTKCFL